MDAQSSSARVHDAFISYSRANKAFAAKLEAALESYTPPRDLDVPQRRLDVFRDENDFTGADYYKSVDEHLRASASLLVICSPEARASTFVNDEIARFAESKGGERIIPVLLAGVPNNEATSGQEAAMAFPEALLQVLQMPLAVNYLNFDPRTDRIQRGAFEGSWYTILANLFGVSRALIEQRERRRAIRRRRITVSVVGGIIATLSVALVVTLISRQRAIEQTLLAQARQLATQADLVATRTPQTVDLIERRALLATEALQRSDSFEDRRAIEEALALLPERIVQLPYDESSYYRAPAVFSRDGRRMAEGTEDSRTRVYDAETGDLIREIAAPGEVDALALSADGRMLATGHFRAGAVLVSVDSGETLLGIPYESRRVFGLAISPDAARLALATSGVGTNYGSIVVEVRAIPSGDLLWSREETDDRLALSFSGDGALLGTGVAAGARILDAATGKEVAVLEGSLVADIEFNPSFPLAAAPDFNGAVHLYDVETGEQGLEIPLPQVTDLVSAMERGGAAIVHFSPNGQRLAVAGGVGIIRVFDIGGMTGLKQVARWDHREPVRALGFLQEGRKLVLTDSEHRLQTFALDTSTPYHEAVVLEEDGVVSLPADGRLAVAGGFDWTAKAYDTRTGEEIFSTSGVAVESVVASRDGRYVALLDRFDENEARVFDLATGTRRARLDLGGEALKIALSDDGRLLAAALDGDQNGQSDAIVVLDIASGVPALRIGDGAPLDMVFDASSSRLAFADPNGLMVVDLSDGGTASRVSDLPGAQAMAFSPDGRILAAGYRDGAFRILDAVAGRLRAELSHDRVLDVAFSTDGGYVAAGGQDRTVRIYRSDSGREAARLHYEDAIRGLAFTADSRGLVTSTGNLVEHREWRAEDLITEACARLTRNLSLEEWRQYIPDEPYRKTCVNLPDGAGSQPSQLLP